MKRKQIQEKRLEELNRLRDIYEICLKSVGEGHREASKQPNITSKAVENETQRAIKAASRGAEARKQQLKNEALHQQQIEAPIKQKRKTRNKENLRSFYVSSLPKHSQLPVDSLKPQKSSNEVSPPAVVPQVLQEVPSNLVVSQASSTGSLISDEKPENEKSAKRNLNVKCQNQKKANTEQVITDLNQEEDNCSSSPKECCCDYVVCSCHNSPPVSFRRRCQSETRLSSEVSLELGIHHPRKTKTRSRSCSPRSVRALNYLDAGNLFESNQRNFVTVTHHSSPPKSKEDLATFIDLKKKGCSTKSNYTKEIKEKIEERGKKALKREHLKKDFQQLLHDLKNLTRRKQILKSRIKTKPRIYQRERDVLARNENKQKKLAGAFETLLHTEKSKQSKISGSPHETTSKTTNDSPPPTLNLALCQHVDMPQLPVIPEDSCVETERQPHRTSPKSGSRGTSSRSPSPTHSADHSYHVNSLVSVRTEPSGNIHVIVKPPNKGAKHKKKCKKFETPPTDSSTSSYCDPPDQLTASELELIENLKKMFKKTDLKKDLRKYIEKLLTMRRESIDCLDIQGSSKNQPLNTKQKIENSLVEVSDLSDHLADKLDELAEIYKQCKRQTQRPPPTGDQHRQLPLPECPRSSCKPSRCSRICPSERTYSPTPIPKPNTLTKRRVLPCPKANSSSRPRENFETQSQPENPGGFQTPFGLSSNLLPLPSEQQTPAFTCPRGSNLHR
ncbi:uncharacterized protein LOC124360547 isoform X2 [Homalodisca vitripennis]|uniref:uncharacterized protein LOC124360547 isoform X2 n=1 Tax=Homalodisca vitripennis TaxID=197043 RepID=UPI001EEBCABB|nr:uncharacterized protein LOC124360547 isoform X2 [Homalodisca vitripennis]